MRPLAFVLVSWCVVTASGSSECKSEAQCSALGSAMLQKQFASTNSATLGNEHDKDTMDVASLGADDALDNASVFSSHNASTLDNASVVQNPSKTDRLKAIPKKIADKAADEAEQAPTMAVNLALFAAFATGIFLLVVAVLAIIQLIVHFVHGSQQEYLEKLDQKPATEAAPARHVTDESIGSASAKTGNLKRCMSVSEAAGEIGGIKLWKRLNGDAVRLGILLDICASDNPEAKATDLIEKGCKAFKLKLSKESIKQATSGLLAMTQAVKRARKVNFLTLSPYEKFREAGNQVLAMVRVSRAFKSTLANRLSTTSSWAGDTDSVDRLNQQYNNGEKNARDFKDTRLQQSAISAYFAGSKWLEHISIAFVFLYSQVCAVVYAMYLKTRFPKMYDFMGPWLLVSRGEAMAVIVLTMLMVILLTRGLITKLRPLCNWSSVLQTIADKHVLIHKWIGMMLVLCAVLHIIGHLCGSIPAIINERKVSKINEAFTYGTKIRFNFNTWGEALVSWPAVTGILLVLILIAFWSLSNEKARRYWFELFHYPHLLLICLWCGTLIAHGWKQWLGIGVPIASVSVLPAVVYYFLERYIAIRHGSREGVRISHAVVKKSTVLLEIDTGSSGYSYSTGMYAMIKCPEISSFQWHPFTIASGGGHKRFNLLIAIAGDWTTKLKDLIVESQKTDAPYPPIAVRGGYGAPAQGMRNQEHIIMVGAGVGCTPFLSFLSTVCDGEEGGAADMFKDLKSAVFYWLSREPEDFVWVNQYNNTIMASDFLRNRVQVRLVMTKGLDASSEDINAAETGLFWLGLEVALTKLDSPELSKELGVPTQFGRPKWEKEFDKVVKDLKEKKGTAPTSISVYVCGNKMLVKSLEDACSAANSGPCKFRLFAEEF